MTEGDGNDGGGYGRRVLFGVVGMGSRLHGNDGEGRE